MPMTLPALFTMPAMSFMAPLGLVPCGVAEDDAAFAFKGLQGFFIADIVAFAVGHGAGDDIAFFHAVGEEGGIVLNGQLHFAADEMQMGIAHEGAGQEARFGDDLEAIADAQNLEAFCGLGADIRHDGRARGDGAAAQIIAIGKTAGDDDEIDLGQFRIGVPDGNGGLCR